MRALPLTSSSGPGGRPRKKRAQRNAFSDWLAQQDLKPKDIAERLGVALSSVYNMRNVHFSPGRKLALKVAEITDGAVSVDSWPPPTRKSSR